MSSPELKVRKWMPSERMGHAIIAIIVAVIIAATTILRPIDIAFWSLQSKMFDREASGEIVFVGLQGDPAATGSPVGNKRLTETIEALDKAGASRIFIDLPIMQSDSAKEDRRLRARLDSLGERIVLTELVREDWTQGRSLQNSDPMFIDGQATVSSDSHPDFLGYVWQLDSVVSGKHEQLQSLSFAMANTSSFNTEVYPNYSINLDSIPQINYIELTENAMKHRHFLKRKTAVIGLSGSSANWIKAPDVESLPSTLVHIVGAETLISKTGQKIGWVPIIGAFAVILLTGILAVHKQRLRRIFYGMLATLLVMLIILSAAIGIRIVFAGVLALFATFALFRLIANYKQRYLFIEERTKLPNFAAMHRDLADQTESISKAIIIAKIARLDAVLATLIPAEQSKYVRQVASRLALGEDSATIYYNGGKYLAFALERSSYDDLEGHLDGLRAISSQSIVIANSPLDVSVTIGADLCSGQPVANRLSSATAAADQAREAYRPVFVISEAEAEHEDWDYSLQARLESALSEDRISIKLQPQMDMRSGKIVGAEALARWHDEEKGEISPASFIGQCERVGRLDDLTKRVVKKSLRAMEKLDSCAHPIKMSVNVSAIQFVDRRIAELLAENLASHSIASERLTIEITETARIEDFSVARKVIEEIKSYGVAVAMDDFGIESANLQVMLELPFDEIKIDQAFVKQMQHSAKAKAIVTNAISMIADAGMVSVAEGIEDRQTYDLLRDSGCAVGQGYFIAHPMPMVEIQKFLNLQRTTLLRTKKYS